MNPAEDGVDDDHSDLWKRHSRTTKRTLEKKVKKNKKKKPPVMEFLKMTLVPREVSIIDKNRA